MKILLVEDSRVLRERLRELIAQMPQAELVGETDNESDARRHLQAQHPDLVVLDLKLRRGSGLTVLEHIHAVYPHVIPLVLTNYGQAEYKTKCLALGAHQFFDKSRDFDDFTLSLSALCQRPLDAATRPGVGGTP